MSSRRFSVTPLLVVPLGWCAMALLALNVNAQDTPRYRLGQATMNNTHIVFSHAGDLWQVARTGGIATRLTETPGAEGLPFFSPDGKQIAFSAGATLRDADVFIMPASGGSATQRTFHPAPDLVAGWTADGARLLFASRRERAFDSELFTLAADAVMPERVPVPGGVSGTFSPDGRYLAYLRNSVGNRWLHYRGGLLADIDIVDLASGTAVDAVPREEVRDWQPMWVGDVIYFVSDRAGTANLFAYDRATKRVTQRTTFSRYGVRHAAAGPDGIVLVVDGQLFIYDWEAQATMPVPLTFPKRAFLEVGPKRVSVDAWVQDVALAPDGQHVAASVRGEVITMDLLSGRPQVKAASHSAERSPAWSPDGERLAYFSDASGEYALYIQGRDVQAPPTIIPVEDAPTFYRELTWSPDGRWLAFSGQRLGLWLADVEAQTTQKVATSPYIAQDLFSLDWSPDGRWLTYAQANAHGIRSIYVYDTVAHMAHRITDGMTQSEYPVFDSSGHYLYFAASNNARMAAASDIGWGLLSSQLNRPLTAKQLHVVVLSASGHAPLRPGLQQPNPNALRQAPCDDVHIDVENIARRILPLPMEPRDIQGVFAGRAGEVFIHTIAWPHTPGVQALPRRPLLHYRWAEPYTLEQVAPDVSMVTLSDDGSTLLMEARNRLRVASTASPEATREVSWGNATLEVDLRAEWKQMYHEVWRKVRDTFYDPNAHGQDLEALETHYASYLPHLRSRADLNGLFGDMLSHLSVSHLRIMGGDIPRREHARPQTGLLGADLRIADGRYQFMRIYRPSPFMQHDPFVQAPLAQVGIDVAEGEYLLAVAGETVTADRNLYTYFTDRALEPITLTVGPRPDGEGARTLTVVPTPNDHALRQAAWAETNRAHVEARSEGQLGYLYIPDYGASVLAFLRQLVGQQNKAGWVIDQRYNGGGVTLDHIIELLQRKPLYHYAYRYGQDFTVMPNVLDGPKALIIHEQNGSAAETFPFMFKLAELGPVVGRRTIGAGIGAALFQAPLVDGGRVIIPNRASYNPNGSWDIENYGVTPDYDVPITLRDWHAGRDSQLETAIDLVLDALKTYETHEKQRPAYPVHPK